MLIKQIEDKGELFSTIDNLVVAGCPVSFYSVIEKHTIEINRDDVQFPFLAVFCVEHDPYSRDWLSIAVIEGKVTK